MQQRAFWVVGPSPWNDLLVQLRSLLMTSPLIFYISHNPYSLAVTGLGAPLSSSVLKRRYISLQNEWMNEICLAVQTKVQTCCMALLWSRTSTTPSFETSASAMEPEESRRNLQRNISEWMKTSFPEELTVNFKLNCFAMLSSRSKARQALWSKHTAQARFLALFITL